MALNLSRIAKQYADEESAYKFIENIRWENGVVCPHCGSVKQASLVAHRNGGRKTRTGKQSFRRVWYCQSCQQEFSVLIGTVMADSKIPLSKWLLAMYEMNAAKNGVSSLELARKLGITQKSAWHLGHRIRFAMAHSPLAEKLSGTVEADETYIGGKAANMHKAKREREIQGRGTVGKVPVFSAVQRGGKVESCVMKVVSSKNVREVLNQRVDKGATLNTDTLPVYNAAGKEFAKHETVDHGAGEYVKGDAHINTAEGYFSQLKRSLSGTYHHVSEKHLDSYLSEFDYRYNTRKANDGDRTNEAIQKTRGKRLTYAALTQGRQ